MPNHLKDLTGKTYGRLKVLERHSDVCPVKWLCYCDPTLGGCSSYVIRTSYSLTRKGVEIKSCGCYHKERLSSYASKHKECSSRLYNIWVCMRSRCYYPNSISYKWYGGRGITVCEEWKNSFEAFRDWALANGYGDLLQLDRMDSNGNYEPDNCRWYTSKQNNRNKRDCRIVTYRGKTGPLAEIVEHFLGANKYASVRTRLHRGWSVEDAISIPFKKPRRNKYK